jgi:hypothetical protein
MLNITSEKKLSDAGESLSTIFLSIANMTLEAN